VSSPILAAANNLSTFQTFDSLSIRVDGGGDSLGFVPAPEALQEETVISNPDDVLVLAKDLEQTVKH
jgi:hypothetical protein